MTVLRCIQKLLSELKIKSGDIPQSSSDLSSWHVNLLRIDRRKCILFTMTGHYILSLSPASPNQIFSILRQHLFKSLVSENIPQKRIEVFLDDMRMIVFAKTNNRSVLGSMNDLALQLKTMIYLDGGLLNADLAGVNHRLNRIPMGGINMKFSIEEMQRLLQDLHE